MDRRGRSMCPTVSGEGALIDEVCSVCPTVSGEGAWIH